MQRTFYLSPRARYGSVKAIALSDAINGFLLTCRARKLSENTIADYSRTLYRFLNHVGDLSIRDINSTQITAFLAAQPWSEKTVLNYHIGLAALWTWAMREGYANKHIVRITDRPRPKKLAIEPLTEKEIRSLLTNCKGRNEIRNRAILFLLLDCGLRASELCGLEYSSIDLNRQHVRVLGKGNKERLIPFSVQTKNALFDHILNEYVKNKSQRPFLFNRNSLAHLIQRLGKMAGINDVHPHRFRHTFAINYLRNGGDAYSLQEILGHTTLGMVKTYLRIAQVDVDQAHMRASPVANWNL